MKTEMTYEEMCRSLDVCGQTFGCKNCGRVWWGENCTEDPLMMHAEGCPLRGRADVHRDATFED